jgi:sRNA-binding regulator protein Hfq
MISFSTEIDSLFIERDFNSDEWYSVSPIKVKIYDIRIQNLFNKVLTIERFQRPLTSNPRYYNFYRVCPTTGTHVIFFDKNWNVLDDIYFGMADIYSYGAVRRANDITVWEIASEIRFDVSPNLVHWRDPFIIRFARDEADSIRVRYSGHEYVLSQSAGTWFFTNDTESFQLTHAHLSFNGLMNQLENLTSQTYIDNQWDDFRELFQKPALELTVYHSNGHVDNVYFIVNSDDEVLVKANDKTDILYKVNLSTINRFTRSATRFQTDLFIYTH